MKSRVAYLTKKFASLSRCCLCTDRAQNLPGPAENNVLRVPQFHPNRVISGGDIAERVNPGQVNPILGDSVAYRQVNTAADNNRCGWICRQLTVITVQNLIYRPTE